MFGRGCCPQQCCPMPCCPPPPCVIPCPVPVTRRIPPIVRSMTWARRPPPPPPRPWEPAVCVTFESGLIWPCPACTFPFVDTVSKGARNALSAVWRMYAFHKSRQSKLFQVSWAITSLAIKQAIDMLLLLFLNYAANNNTST